MTEQRDFEIALETLTANFERTNPTPAETARYNRDKDRLESQIAAKKAEIEREVKSLTDYIVAQYERITTITSTAAENFARQTAICDITPAEGSGPDEDNPLTRWYVCTYLDENGNPLPWYPRLDKFGNPLTGESAHQDAVAISVQEYRLQPVPPAQAEQPTPAVPPLQAGQYHSQDFCEFFEDGCREVRRGHYSYWVSTSPPEPEPRFSSSRRYDTIDECVAIHGQCHSQETERTATNPDATAFGNSVSTYVPTSYGTYEYISAEQCEDYHRSCEVVLAPGNQRFYVPTITGRVYVGGNDFPETSDDRESTNQESIECAQNHGSCYEYKRDGNGDGDFNDPEDSVTYVPYSTAQVTVTYTTYNNDGSVRERERVTVPHSDSRAPDRSAPEDTTPDPNPIPHSAVHVDDVTGETSTPSDTQKATEYSTGSACLEANAGAGVVCGQGDNGNWYRLRSWKPK